MSCAAPTDQRSGALPVCVCVCVQLDDMALMFVKARKMWSSVLKAEMVGGWHGGGGCRRVTALMTAGSTFIWPYLRQDGTARKRLAARNHKDTLLMIQHPPVSVQAVVGETIQWG